MTPKKLEDHLKEALLRREIRPSSDSWEKIANRLDAVQKPVKRHRAGWIYLVAASLLLLLGLRLFLPAETPPGESGVVVSPQQSPSESPAGTGQQSPDVVKTPAETSLVQARDNSDPQPPKPDKIAVSLSGAGKAPGKDVPATQEQFATNAPDTAGLGARIGAGLNSVPAAVAGMEGQKQPVTDQAVESLLRQAQEDIARDQYGADRIDVDALSLLSDAEQELEQTFREQILEKLKTGFNRVRTAVASRND